MPAWRRNLYVLFVVQLLSVAGFSLVFPFLSLYVKEIGVATGGSIEFWSGMVFSSQALTMMLASPLWGVYSDRHGRKLMLVRATLGGAVLVVLMGFVQNAEQLVALRVIQGGVTGVVSAASALVAATAPREKSGEALGLLSMGRAAGVAVGPVIGGVIGDTFGFRESFWITGVLLALAGVAVLVWVQEDFTPVARDRSKSTASEFRRLLTAPGMSGLYELNFLRSLGHTMIFPLLSLFVVQLVGSEAGAATRTGLIIGAASLSGAISSVYLGRMGDRVGHTRILMFSAGAAVLLYLPQPFVTSVWQLGLLQLLSGFAVGGIIPAIAALMNLWAPAGNQGAIYGLDNSVNAAARGIAPMIAAGVALWLGLRGVFAAAGVVYLLIVLLSIHVASKANDAGRQRGRPRASSPSGAPGD
ncbi:MAG: MFS transporter [Litorilinea sp.]